MMDVNKKEYSNDSTEAVSTGSTKYDGGKSPVYRGLISYFPNAVEAIARVSEFGAAKYAWGGWRSVDQGFDRYSDALVRHLLEEGAGKVLDKDSGFLNAAHTAWNALARLELLLLTQEHIKEEVTEPV